MSEVDSDIQRQVDRLALRVDRLEADADRQRTNRRQMIGLLIGSVMAFAGTLIIALLNHFVFT